MEYLASQIRRARGNGQGPEHPDRRRRRPDRRLPAALGRVPRRADHRGAQPDRPRLRQRRQPRVRRGCRELLRIQNGGCHPATAAADRHAVRGGADFRYLVRERLRRARPASRFSRRTRSETQGVQIGFIGMTLEGTADIVTPSGVAGLDVRRRGRDGEPVRRRAPGARASRRSSSCCTRAGRRPAGRPGTSTAATSISGPIGAIPDRAAVDDAIDVVSAGHTHQPYNCRYGARPGNTLRHQCLLQRAPGHRHRPDHRPGTGDVAEAGRGQRRRRPETSAADADHDRTDRVLATLLGPSRTRSSATTADDLTRDAETPVPDALGQSPLGDLIADGQLAGTPGGAVAALMNPGGVRAEIRPGPSHVRGGVHRPAVRQLPDADHADRRAAPVRARAAVPGRATRPAARRASRTRSTATGSPARRLPTLQRHPGGRQLGDVSGSDEPDRRGRRSRPTGSR